MRQMPPFFLLLLLLLLASAVPTALSAQSAAFVCASLSADLNAPPSTQSPLRLTPMLEGGDAAAARSRARVPPLLADGCCESYAGFLTVNERYDANLLFWYFPAEDDASGTAPLIVWLQGGPGTSMLRSVFVENGPYLSDPATQTLRRNPGAWTRSHSVLYFDNPVGTGYSFSTEPEGLSTNIDEVVDNLLGAMEQFFVLFPEHRGRDLYVTGESYGGKMAVALAYAIIRRQPGLASAPLGVNLKGLLVVNAFLDPGQMDKTDLAYALGLVDEEGRDELSELSERQLRLIRQANYSGALEMAHDGCFGMLSRELTGLEVVGNLLLWRGSPDKGFQDIAEQACIRNALHVGATTFRAHSMLSAEAMRDLPESVLPTLAVLTDFIPVVVVNGQLDTCMPYRGTADALRRMTWRGAGDLLRSTRTPWCVDGLLAGYSRTVRSLTHVLVRDAGHFACQDQPLWTLRLLSRFIARDAFNDTCR